MNKESIEKIPEHKVTGGLYRLLGELFKVLSSPTRIQILHLLYPQSQRKLFTFSQIMFGIQKNPSTVNFHLEKLMKYGLVEKVEEGKYRITEVGTFALKADPANIIAMTEKAIETGKAEGYIVSQGQ